LRYGVLPHGGSPSTWLLGGKRAGNLKCRNNNPQGFQRSNGLLYDDCFSFRVIMALCKVSNDVAKTKLHSISVS
jgi:hypothetical protein